MKTESKTTFAFLKFHNRITAPLAAVVLLSLSAACGPMAGGTPSVASNLPEDNASDIPRNASVSVTFSELMDPATLTTSTFTLTAGPSAEPVAGTVIYSELEAVFWPASHLDSDASYQATVTTGAKSASGVALESDHTFAFSTGSTLARGLPVNLGTAADFVIVAKSGISTVPTSVITGDMAVSPAAASYVTGFSLTADSSNEFASSPQVTGDVYAADYSSPTPDKLTTAVSSMELAFTDAAGRAPDFTEHGAGDIGGMTLSAGVYKWGTGLLIPTNVTLSGDASDVWIFQIAEDLTVASATNIFLAGGAMAKNVFWQVSGQVDIGTTAHFEGIVLSQTAIALQTGASINGRLLAQTSVDLDSNVVTQPAE